MPALWPRQEVCKRWPQRLYLACLPLKLGGFSRLSLLPLTAGSQGSWDCTIVRPTEDHLLFPQEPPTESEYIPVAVIQVDIFVSTTFETFY